jgi:hypothetical protein
VTGNDPRSSGQATASVDVDPKAAAFAAWATELAGRAVWASGRATVPEWVGTVAELLYDWAAGLPWANGQVGTAGQAGTTQSTGVEGTHGAFLGGMLAGIGLPAAPPSPPPGQPLAKPPTTARAPQDQLRAARLAVGVADGLAAALRAGDAEQAAKHLAAFEQASPTYHATAGKDPGDDADGEASS